MTRKIVKTATEMAALWFIAVISENRKGCSHHTSTAFPPEECVHRLRTGGSGFSFILLLFTSQSPPQQTNQGCDFTPKLQKKIIYEVLFINGAGFLSQSTYAVLILSS